MQDRAELKALVDFYATESDKNNQDCYVEIFRPDIKLDVYFGDKLGMQARDNGTCYALATLVTEQDGKDVLTTHAVRYYDKYVKIEGRWWIAEREQHFEWSTNQVLG